MYLLYRVEKFWLNLNEIFTAVLNKVYCLSSCVISGKLLELTVP